MASHKFACPKGVLHARISDVRQVVTIESIRQLFRHSGDGYVICAYERVVDGMYGVEAYVEFRSRWRAARARAALDGHAMYDGCCILAIDLVPPVYTTITMPDDDGMAPSYFYDDTPYAEWTAALAVAECHDEAPATSISSAVAPLSMTTVDIVPELAAPVESDEAADVVATVVTAPALFNRASGGLDHNADGGDSIMPCLAPWSTSTLVSSSYTSTLAAAASNISITKELAEETGTTHLIRDSLMLNSEFKFCLVKLLFQDDYALEARPDCHVSGCKKFVAHNDNDFESECKTLARCHPNIPDVAMNMSDISFSSPPPAKPPDTYGTVGTLMAPHSKLSVIFLGVPLVWSHLKMEKITEFYSVERTIILKAQMMLDLFVLLMGLEPWPSWQLYLSILTVMICPCGISVCTNEFQWKNRMMPRVVPQLQTDLFQKASCRLQVGKLQKFIRALVDLKPWPYFVLHSDECTYRLPWSPTKAIANQKDSLLLSHAPSWRLYLSVFTFSPNLHDMVCCNKTVGFNSIDASISEAECGCELLLVIFPHIACLLKLASPDGSPVYMQVRLVSILFICNSHKAQMQDKYFSVQLPWVVIHAMVVITSCLPHSGFELMQWRIAWVCRSLILQFDIQFCTLGNDLIIAAGSNSVNLTTSCTSYACVKRLHHGMVELRDDLLLLEYNPFVEILFSLRHLAMHAKRNEYLELLSTKRQLETILLIMRSVIVEFLKKEEFTKSGSFTVRATVEAIQLPPTENICFPLPSAKPPEKYDKCSFILAVMHSGFMVGLYFACWLPHHLATPFEQSCTSIHAGFSHSYETFNDLCFSLACMCKLLQGFPAGPCLYCVLLEIDKVRQYFIVLVELQPWPSSELSLLIVKLVPSLLQVLHILLPAQQGQYSSCNFRFERDIHHDYDCFLWAIGWLLVDSSCASSDFEESKLVTTRRQSYLNYPMPTVSPVTLKNGHISENGREVQVVFEFVHPMNWKIAQVLYAVHTDEVHSDQCVFSTGWHHWYNMGRPKALILMVVHVMFILQALQPTWNADEKLLSSVQYVVQMLWDPGGSTWSRLEGKPKFKKGGIVSDLTMGLSYPARPSPDGRRISHYKSAREDHGMLGLERTGGFGLAWRWLG